MNKERFQWREDGLAPVLDEPMRRYDISKSAYFEAFIKSCKHREGCRQSMQELRDRYDINHKRILALGPGVAEQEFWFSGGGNQLFLLDIDEYNVLSERLSPLKGPAEGDESIVYIIGDARLYPREMKQSFDVLLSFGFTPDEYHKATVSKRYSDSGWGWPVNAEPFIEILMQLCSCLPEGGLFLMLSYAGGLDSMSLTYLPAVRDQLQAVGCFLLDVYALDKATGVHMIIAQKGAGSLKPSRRTPITRMHERSEIKARPFFLSSIDPILQEHNHPFVSMIQAIVRSVAPNVSRGFYMGPLSVEAQALLVLGIDVTVLATQRLKTPFKAAPGYGTLNILEAIPTSDTFDLLWCTDHDPSSRRNATFLIQAFLHPIVSQLSEKGVFVMQGIAGCDLKEPSRFVEKLDQELAVYDMFLESLDVLAIDSGVFLMVAKKKKAPASLAPIEAFWPGAEDATAFRIYGGRLSVKASCQRMFRRLLGRGRSAYRNLLPVSLRRKIRKILSYSRSA